MAPGRVLVEPSGRGKRPTEMRCIHGLLVVAAAAALVSCGDSSDEVVATGDEAETVAASCEDIEAFAAVLDETGIAYDYDPSDSPAELAGLADEVISGSLTGNVTFDSHTVQEDPHPWTFTGFEITVDRSAKTASELEAGDTSTVYVEYSPTTELTEDQFRAAATAGTPVVVFAGTHKPLGELAAFMTEGFMTACPDGPLLGRFGTQGAWAGIDSLDAVIDTVDPTAQTTTSTSSPPQPDTSSIPTTSAAPEVPAPQHLGVPDRGPDVTGTVGADDEGRPGILLDPSDTYFTRMALTRGEPTVVDLDTAEELDFADLRAGDRIGVWIDGGCAESFPVQCTVTAIGVNRGR